MLLLKNSMFHENYVINSVKCFYCIKENQHSHVVLGKYLDNLKL